MIKKKFTVDFFIEKFKAIPAKDWTILVLNDHQGRRCAFGHCGVMDFSKTLKPEAKALDTLFKRYGRNVITINDGIAPLYRQKTPKGRILAALKDIKREQL